MKDKVMKFDFKPEKIDTLIQLAIKEDIGTGDITTENLITDSLIAEGSFIAKESGVIAGLPVVEYFFSKLDKGVSLKQNVRDGTFVKKGENIASIKGSAKTLLSGERIALNFLQRLSGIATLTAQFVERIKPLKTAIMDTRKTIPGWRYLEKYAVRVGGGVNHRMGLYDQILIKDNHLKVMGSERENGAISRLVKKAREQIENGILIEVEVEDLSRVKDVVDAGVDIILFDNMTPAKIKEAVDMVKEFEKSASTGKAILTEASGNITIQNVEDYAKAGVDRISVGANRYPV